ncbi:MAG TPA: hypothetical protein VK536_03820 [Candidatus Limnocylindrales bacterium]|nr:hypothetical protein [Candidatus Limnocylindrales bacterium]
MFKANRKYVLLPLICVFAFIYRMVLMFWQNFPPGADIGLHASVINSITGSGNTNFLYDYYQMGGGQSLTFPGYHIFASGIMLVTGMSDYVAQAVIVAFFSSLIVLIAFLITKTVWAESAAFIVAFLVAVSRFDIEMLMWAGYPDVITLLLIPVTFYLFLQRQKFSLTPFLVSTSILAGSIFLTHSLSSAVFVGITALTVFFVLIAPKTFGTTRKNVLFWLLPLLGGALLVSPFLVSAVPDYLRANSSFTAVSAINRAILATRVLPLDEVLALFACLLPYLLLSKKYQGRFFSLPSFLLIMWLFVPLVLTQGYMFGLYVDYNRFLYFLVLPVIILFAVMIDHGSAYFARVLDAYHTVTSQLKKAQLTANKLATRISSSMTRKRIYSIFVLGFILIFLVTLPIFAAPWEAVTIQSFYQVMDNPRYQAIQWVKQNTAPGSVFVSDAEYGWWLGGFAERPTLSAVQPQFLTVDSELAPATVASNLLDTDYVIDNGYIQVREDGGFIGRHNPEFLADLNWTYFPFPFFQFNDSEITLLSQNAGSVQSTDITQVPVTNMQLIGAQSDGPSIIVDKAGSNFSYSEILTVAEGVSFANMTIVVKSDNQNVSFDWINFILNSQGEFLQPTNNTVAMLDAGMKEVGQLIFVEGQPQIFSFNPENPCVTQLSYNLQGRSSAEIQILVGIYQVSENDVENQASLDKTLMYNVQNAQKPSVSLPMTTFDYKEAIQANSISYIANRDLEVNPKFADDPEFSLVFINNEVAIFKVKSNVNQAGG